MSNDNKPALNLSGLNFKTAFKVTVAFYLAQLAVTAIIVAVLGALGLLGLVLYVIIR